MSRRILCLTIPDLPTDRLERALPGPRLDRPSGSGCARDRHAQRPVAVFERHGGALRIAACSAAARARGIAAGMTLTEARAFVPALAAFPRDPGADEQALARLGDRAGRWGPTVGLIPAEGGLPAAVVVEVGGSAHLFGGEAALVAGARETLARAGYAAGAAIAATIGTAYALAGFGSAEAPPVIPPGGEAAALAWLPVAALRIAPETVRRLARLGVRTVAQLAALPRRSLGCRFGPAVLERLGQALGEVAEPIVPYRPLASFAARLDFPEPSDRPEALLFALRRLLDDAAAWLLSRGEGARRLAIALRGDGACAEAAAGPGGRSDRVEVDVGLVAPRRDPRRLLALIRTRLETVAAPERIAGVELAVLETGPLRYRQSEAFAGAAAPREAIADLVDRLVVRLGERRVLRAEMVADARPERACRFLPVARAPARSRSGSAPRAPPGRASGALSALLREGWPVRERRPVRLFAPPRPVLVEAFRFLRGPERIETGWWERPSEEGTRRDYHEVEDRDGRRFWVYRAGDRWYCHGSFF